MLFFSLKKGRRLILCPQGVSKLPLWLQLWGNSGHLRQHLSLCWLPTGTRVSKRYALPYFFSEHPWEAPEVTKTLHTVESPVLRQHAQLVTHVTVTYFVLEYHTPLSFLSCFGLCLPCLRSGSPVNGSHSHSGM